MGIKLEERETRFERATSTLARLRSTTELHPHRFHVSHIVIRVRDLSRGNLKNFFLKD